MLTLTKHDAVYYPATERQKASWKEYIDSGRKLIMNISDLSDFHNPDIVSLDKTVRALLHRHESLRTCFRLKEGKLMQYIYPPNEVELKITQVDCSKNLFSKIKSKRVIRKVQDAPFNLEEGPQIRFCLIHLGNQQFKLATSMNHIISDAASLKVLKDDFIYFYTAFAKEAAVALKPLEFQLKDFAQWEQELLQSPAGKGNLAYWEKELDERGLQKFQLVDSWKKTSPFSSFGTKNGGEYLCFLDESMLEKIQTLSWKTKTSKGSVLYAALFMLLYTLSGEKDQLIISPISLRNRRSLKKIVGYMNTDIFLRIQIDKDASIKNLIKGISEKYFQALEHRYYPMNQLLDKGHYYCGAVLNELPGSRTYLQNFQAKILSKNIGKPSRFPLFIMLTEFQNGAQLDTIYDRQIFSDRNIGRVMHKYIKLLGYMLECPDAKISSICIR